MNPKAKAHVDYPRGCPACECTHMTLQEIEESFDYGVGSSTISVVAKLPVYTCENCGTSFSDELAEERRHEAVCHKLGVMSPGEVRAIRESRGLSQTEFAALSGVGKASLGRWERGALIQNQSNDNLLRLLAFPENVARLRAFREPKACTNVIPFERKFASLAGSPDEGRLRNEAARFQLYAC